MDFKTLFHHFVLLIVTAYSSYGFLSRAGAQTQQVTICELKTELLRCPVGLEILITHVLYGRVPPLNINLCNPYQSPIPPNLNCVGDATATKYVENLCNQQTSCNLQNDWRQLGKDPCNLIPKYLKVDYQCIVPTTTSKTTTPTTTRTTPTTSTTSTTTTTTTTTTPTTTTTSTTTTTPTTTSTSTSTSSSMSTSTSASTSTSTTTPTTTRATTPTSTRPPPTQAPFVPFSAPKGSQACHDYLITGPHGVKDSQLSASSVWGQMPDNHGPSRSRLFSDAVYYPNNGTYNRGAWVARDNTQQQYIQVMLNSPTLVRGIATQGRHVNRNDLCCYQYVKKYKIMYSMDCVNYETVKDQQGNDMIYKGNVDQDSVVTHMICPFVARCVRINPVDWKDKIAMRFDLLGCPANTPDLGHCPKGWEEIPGTNKCYLVTDVHDMRTRDDASAQCQLQQAHLVDIDSIQERDWIRQKVAILQRTQGQHHFWTGLANRPRADSLYYKWTDGSSLNTAIMPWGNGQPDNTGGNEHCGELWDGDMNDNDCNQHYPYICEKDKYWKPPVNAPSLVTNTPPVTTRTTFAPPQIATYHLPTLKTSVSIGPNIFTTGCIQSLVPDCGVKPAGDYQACRGCHYYTTCAPNGVWIRPCPANLKWDDNLKTCTQLSSTCVGP